MKDWNEVVNDILSLKSEKLGSDKTLLIFNHVTFGHGCEYLGGQDHGLGVCPHCGHSESHGLKVSLPARPPLP